MAFLLATAVLIFIFDQLTKLWVKSSLYLNESRPILPGIFHLTLVTNTGSAFGLFPGARVFFIVLSILTLAVLLSLAWRKRKEMPKAMQFCFGLLSGGVLGNLLDRYRFGCVVDFLDFRIWPVFNLADSSITIAVILLSFRLIKGNRHASHPF